MLTASKQSGSLESLNGVLRRREIDVTARDRQQFLEIVTKFVMCENAPQDLPSLSTLSHSDTDDSAGERDGSTLNAIGRYPVFTVHLTIMN